MNKICNICKIDKKIEFFSKNKSRKDGYDSFCKLCKKEYDAKRNASNKDAFNARNREYYLENKNSINLKSKKYRIENQEKLKMYYQSIKEFKKDYFLKRKYGITLEDKNKMLITQNNKCKICERVFDELFLSVVDHCHETGTVRGLLCNPCNQAIGLLKENINSIKNAIKYLDQ